MNDPANPRQILPSTVSSNSGTGPSTSAVARISVACESCKRKKCKVCAVDCINLRCTANDRASAAADIQTYAHVKHA